jgi:hypothetical protein
VTPENEARLLVKTQGCTCEVEVRVKEITPYLFETHYFHEDGCPILETAPAMGITQVMRA